MSNPAWMPLYIADYIADTQHLGALEHGAYLMLIMHYWRVGSLPNDDKKLARIAKVTDREWRAIRGTIADLFDGNWTHKRIDFELEKARRKSEARADAGKRGGEANALKSNDAALANATILPEQNAAVALASSSHSPSPSEKGDGSNIYPIYQPSSSPPPAPARRAAYPFPDDGKISFGRFGEACRQEAPGVDPDVIGKAFSDWAKAEAIPFDREDIDRVFRTFAKRHRVSGRRA
jgi:uncharacterized protein YdaU (DUF1376 family)